MAGQFRFKNGSGTVVAQISASNAGAISFSGSAVDFSSVTSLTLGTTTLAGTASMAVTSSNAMTASSADTLYVRNNATVLGSITAQTLVVQTVTSSVEYVTGSTRFGSIQANTHEITGSLYLTGSVAAFSNNLGVGTTSPSKRLHLYASNDAASVRFTNTAANKVWDLAPANPNVANTGFSLYNVTDNTTPVHVTDTGNLGIGITTPQTIVHAYKANTSAPTSGTTPSGYGLTFTAGDGNNGGLWFSADLGGDQGISGIAGTRVSGYETDLRFYTNNTSSARAFTERMRITSGGNIGIGTASPLAASGYTSISLNNTSNGGILDLQTNGTSVARLGNNGTSLAFLETRTATPIYISTNDTTRMVITSGGNIGIGNTGNSSRRLEVSQPSGYSAGIRIIADSGGDAKIQFLASGGSSQPDIGPTAASPNDLIFSAGGGERMRITSDNNIVTGYARELATTLFPSNPYTSDLQLIVTHSSWGSNYDSGTLYIEFSGRTYGNNQITAAYGTILYRMDTNGLSINSVTTTGVTLSNVTISSDVSTNLLLKVTFQIASVADRLSVFARTLNTFVTSVSANLV